MSVLTTNEAFTPRCKQCVHWVKHQTQLGMGVCFALPPTPVIVQQAGQVAQANLRPITGGEEGCGMFHQRPENVTPEPPKLSVV